MAEQLKKAKEGQRVEIDGESYILKHPCESSQGGHWYCDTHKKGFSNQLMKDIHIGRGIHTLVWICHTHGPEAP